VLDWVLNHGSYAVLFILLVMAGFGAPIPEDIVLLAGGVLAHHGVTYYPLMLVMCFMAVLLADTIIFSTGRKLGPAAYSSPRFARLLPQKRRERIERLYARHGGIIILLARHLAGLRTPFFAMAGIHGMKLKRFVMWDALALCITAPLVTGLGYFFSDRLDLILKGVKKTEHFALLGVVILLSVYWLLISWRSYKKNFPKSPS